MAVIKQQTKLSQLPKRCPHTPLKPNHLLHWEKHRPKFRKFILLHLIQVAEDYQDPKYKLTAKQLIQELSHNMGGIIKPQIQLYVENLIYLGYLSETYLGGFITCTDKIYDELKTIDKIIYKTNQIKGKIAKGANE